MTAHGGNDASLEQSSLAVEDDPNRGDWSSAIGGEPAVSSSEFPGCCSPFSAQRAKGVRNVGQMLAELFGWIFRLADAFGRCRQSFGVDLATSLDRLGQITCRFNLAEVWRTFARVNDERNLALKP